MKQLVSRVDVTREHSTMANLAMLPLSTDTHASLQNPIWRHCKNQYGVTANPIWRSRIHTDEGVHQGKLYIWEGLTAD